MNHIKIYEEYNEYNDEIEKVFNSKVGDILPESYIYQYAQYLHRYESQNFILKRKIEEFSKYKLEEINISDFNFKEWHVDKDYIKFYIKKLKENNNQYPPIIAYNKSSLYSKGKYGMIDGNHRLDSLYKSGFKIIKAWIGIK